MASEAFERSEQVSKAHPNMEITDAHMELARNPSLKVRRGTTEGQADEKKEERMKFRVGNWLKKVVRNLKADS